MEQRTVDSILALLHAYRSASSDDDAAYDKASSDLWDLAPDWWIRARQQHAEHGTPMAEGDPQDWSPDDVAELIAMLAIAAL